MVATLKLTESLLTFLMLLLRIDNCLGYRCSPFGNIHVIFIFVFIRFSQLLYINEVTG